MDAFYLLSPHAPAERLRVVAVRGSEALSECYRFELTCTCDLDRDLLASLETSLPGSRASFHMAGTSIGRWAHGVITAVVYHPPNLTFQTGVALLVEPSLTLLGMSLRSRIFQNLTIPEVADQVLRQWRLPFELRLDRQYTKRVYLTQYEETDYAFLRRILAAEGIFFFFEQPEAQGGKPGHERLVLSDAALFYPTIPGGETLRHATSAEDGALAGRDQEEVVFELSRTRALRSKVVLLGNFDFRKPTIQLRTDAAAQQPAELGLEPEHVRAYHHGQSAEIEGSPPNAELAAQQATSVLEQYRRDTIVAAGSSRARRLLPGHTFRLTGHPLEHLDQSYVVTRIDHEGRLPEEAGGDVVYQNRFECVPANVPFRPPPMPSRRRQVCETATVVGAGDEPIFTDDSGRIKVRFHWDLEGAGDDQSSCWLRVAQSWAGTHFGMQLIPRVGMEVLVTFLGGDVDRPIVTGCLYNATHPLPFEVPVNKAISGLRTQSVPGDSGGFNELSFDDEAGNERVLLHAERDLVEEVGHDRNAMVGRHDGVIVEGNQRIVVNGERNVRIAGDQLMAIDGNSQLAARGSSLWSAGGDADMQVGQQLTTRVDGREHKEVHGDANLVYSADITTRVHGHATTVVGEHDARKSHTIHVEGSSTSYSTGTTLISADKDLVLRCGDAMLRLTPESIELRAPSMRVNGDALELAAEESLELRAPEKTTLKSKQILMEAESSFLGLGKIAKLNGQLVKLNCQSDPVDELEPPEPPKITKFTLTDEDGKPLSKQRFVLVLADGSELTGMLDEDGKAELELTDSGDIIFPDVDNPRPG